jgi:hypothetical protein
VTLPPECDGWEKLYPPQVLFAEDRRAFEESRFWFHDAVHCAEAYYPFDAMLAEYISAKFQPDECAPLRGPDITRGRASDPGRLRLPEPELDHRRSQ